MNTTTKVIHVATSSSGIKYRRTAKAEIYKFAFIQKSINLNGAYTQFFQTEAEAVSFKAKILAQLAEKNIETSKFIIEVVPVTVA
jgi:hypothetical protein